jgi:hypothetical protein
VSAFASAELRNLQLRFRIQGSSSSTQLNQSVSAPGCPQNNPDRVLLCDLEQQTPVDESLSTVRLSLEGGTRNPWFSYGLSRTETTTDLER